MVKENGITLQGKLGDDRFLYHCKKSFPRTTTGTIKNKDSEGVSKQSYISLAGGIIK